MKNLIFFVIHSVGLYREWRMFVGEKKPSGTCTARENQILGMHFDYSSSPPSPTVPRIEAAYTAAYIFNVERKTQARLVCYTYPYIEMPRRSGSIKARELGQLHYGLYVCNFPTSVIPNYFSTRSARLRFSNFSCWKIVSAGGLLPEPRCHSQLRREVHETLSFSLLIYLAAHSFDKLVFSDTYRRNDAVYPENSVLIVKTIRWLNSAVLQLEYLYSI